MSWYSLSASLVQVFWYEGAGVGERTRVENNLLIRRKLPRNGLPKRLEVIRVGDDIPGTTPLALPSPHPKKENSLSPIIMRIQHRIRPTLRNKLNRLPQVLHIRRIHITSHIIRHQPLHQEGHTEDVHAGVAQGLDGRCVGEGVVFVEFAGDVVLAEFGAGFADSDPCLPLLVLCVFGGGMGRGEVQVKPDFLAEASRLVAACTRPAALAAIIKLANLMMIKIKECV